MDNLLLKTAKESLRRKKEYLAHLDAIASQSTDYIRKSWEKSRVKYVKEIEQLDSEINEFRGTLQTGEEQ